MNHLLDMSISSSSIVWICCMIGLVFSVQSEIVYDASRYDLIIEREPFGQEVVIEEPTVTPERELALANAAAQAADVQTECDRNASLVYVCVVPGTGVPGTVPGTGIIPYDRR